MRIDNDNFIKELKKKNQKALNYLVDNYSNLIFKVTISILGSEKREDAVECVNDVVLKVWQNINFYDESKSSFSSWLIAISKYNAIDYRRRLVKKDEEQNIEDLMLSDDHAVEDKVIESENKEELMEAISNMGPIDKDIFIRRYFVGESINEICESLNLSRTAVDNRILRGKKHLKQKLLLLREEIV